MGSVVLVHDEQFEDTVTVSKEGLTFEKPKNKRLYKWEEITNIFNWLRASVICIIDAQGNVNCGNIGPSNFKTYDEDLNYIWQEWFNNIPAKETIKSFEYPHWCIKKEKGLAIRNVFEGICGGIVIWGLGTLCLALNIVDSLKAWVFLVSGGIVGLLFFIWSLVNFKKYIGRNFKHISVTGSIINVIYEDGTTCSYNIPSVRKVKLHSPANIEAIIFENGTKIKHLDRVSYWPILRDYLLSKLEPTEKN